MIKDFYPWSSSTLCLLISIFLLLSCKSSLSVAEKLDLSSTPVQVVDSMNIIQTQEGKLQMRIFAPKLEKYDADSLSYDLFPNGLNIFSYNEKGELESTISSLSAIHESKSKEGKEIWKAYGDVRIKNIIKQETMLTDTLYWDRSKAEIYTDCYIKMFSKDGLVQGYGMRSDEKVRNAEILKPFNSYTVLVKDSTEVSIDTANFIGPLLKKI